MAQSRKFNNGDTTYYWTVLDYDRKSRRYFCRCKCGTEKYVNVTRLGNGLSKSCGCFLSENRRNKVVESDFEAIRKSIMRGYVHGAANRGYSFNYDFKYNGLDRIDNAKGYEDGNVVTCCKHCNKAKLEMSFEEFQLFIKRISSYMEKNHDIFPTFNN